jgi:predicted nuclease of predicted toxin-antitoxin system
MRFLVDENAGPSVARWLREQGHDVFSVFESARGISDDEVILKAYADSRILITSDKDFGEKVYREQSPHHGIILLRLHDERLVAKLTTLSRLISAYSERLPDQFVVVSEKRVRFARSR